MVCVESESLQQEVQFVLLAPLHEVRLGSCQLSVNKTPYKAKINTEVERGLEKNVQGGVLRFSNIHLHYYDFLVSEQRECLCLNSGL